THGSPTAWAMSFIVSGVIALACIPTVFVFEHFRWEEASVRITSFAATTVCACSAGMYLLTVRRRVDYATIAGIRTRTLAYLAVALAGGFLLLVAGMLVLFSFLPN